MLGAILIGLLLYGSYHGLALGRSAVRASRGARTAASAIAGDALPPLDTVRGLRRDLAALERHLAALDGLLGRPARALDGRAGLFIGEGLAAARQLCGAAWWLALRLESELENHGVVTAAPGVPVRLEAQPARALGLALLRERPALLAARASLQRIRDAAGAWPLPAVVREALRAGPHLADALLIAGQLLAAEGERHYLLLIQNADERRATGGFISSVARLTVRDGRLIASDYVNSKDIEAYHTSHPAAPEPLRQHMQAGILLFRDGNWSPDFPTSAEVIAALYAQDAGVPVHGVVTVDDTLAALLLEALGPLPVPEYDVTVTSENVMEAVVAFWERPLAGADITERHTGGAAWLTHRKDFGGALLAAGLERLRTIGPAQVPALLRALDRAVAGRHLLAWAADPPLQRDLERAGVDGGLVPAGGDYIMVVDANLGWNKADRYVTRSISYSVDLSAHLPVGSACVTYVHGAPPAAECTHRTQYEDSYDLLAQQCYWNYVRVLVPGGSAPTAYAGLRDGLDRTSEAGLSAFGGLVLVPSGTVETACVEYTLPAGIVSYDGDLATYRLYIQKQPGTRGVPVTVSVTLPDGARPQRPAAGWQALSGRWVHTLDLTTDRALTLRWRAPQ